MAHGTGGKVVKWTAIAFVLFYVLGSPIRAASNVKDLGEWLGGKADAAVTFATELAP